MKKIITLLAVFFSVSLFAQAPASSTFNYKAKFEGVNTPEKAQEVVNTMKTVYRTTAIYNESSGEFDFSSTMSINQTAFNRMMSGEGYIIESFEKTEVKAAVPVTAPTTTEPKKEATTSATTNGKSSGK